MQMAHVPFVYELVGPVKVPLPHESMYVSRAAPELMGVTMQRGRGEGIGWWESGEEQAGIVVSHLM